METKLRLDCTTVKFLDGKTGEGQAVFATMDVIDKDDDVTLKGAFGEQTAAMVPAHDWRAVPIGKVRIHEEKDEAIADFKMNLDTEMGRDWYQALKFDLDNKPAKQQYSYGFTIKEHSFGEFENRPVRFLKSMLVHEVSPVLVGAGVNTRTRKLKGQDDVDPNLVLIKSALSEAVEKTQKTRLAIVKDIAEKSKLDPAVIFKMLSGDTQPSKSFFDITASILGLELEAPKSAPAAQRVIKCHSSEVKDGVWDWAANEGRIRAAQNLDYYERMFAWRDIESDAGSKGAWKFGHHFVEENGDPGAACVRACILGIGVLNGAKGGTTIPEADRRGVWTHLARHLEDNDITPPVLRSSDEISAKLADQLEWLLWDAEAVISRVKSIQEMRMKQGRQLPEDRVEQLSGFAKLLSDLDDLIKRPKLDDQAAQVVQGFMKLRHRAIANMGT